MHSTREKSDYKGKAKASPQETTPWQEVQFATQQQVKASEGGLSSAVAQTPLSSRFGRWKKDPEPKEENHELFWESRSKTWYPPSTPNARSELGIIPQEEEEEEEEECSSASDFGGDARDDGEVSLPHFTFRVFLIGSFFAAFSAVLATILNFKSSAPPVNAYFAALLTAPIGNLCSRILPCKKLPIRFPWSDHNLFFSLNPGPFTMQEHVLITVMAASGGVFPYAGNIISTLTLNYKRDVGQIPCLILLLSTQLIGYGLVGAFESLLVRSKIAVWPQNQVLVALLRMLHNIPSSGSPSSFASSHPGNGYIPLNPLTSTPPPTAQSTPTPKNDPPMNGTASTTQQPQSSHLNSIPPKDRSTTIAHETRLRFRFFYLSFSTIFLYQFLPSAFFPALSSVALLCLAAGSSNVTGVGRILKSFGSGYHGFGILGLSFDWSMIGSLGPLYTPFVCSVNFLGGMAAMMWIIGPFLWSVDLWSSQKFPHALDMDLYNVNFERLDVESIVNMSTLSLNEDAFRQIGPLLLTPMYAVGYAVSFAALSSAAVAAVLYHNQALLSWFRPEPEFKMPCKSAEIPKRWYPILFGITLTSVFALITFSSELEMPLWAATIAVGLAFIMLPASGIVAAISNIQLGANVISQLIAGFLLPGEAVSNMMFKSLAHASLSQGLKMCADLKLGNQTNTQLQSVFAVRCLGTIIGACATHPSLHSVIYSKRPYLDGSVLDSTGQWTGRTNAVFFAASVVFGLVGPRRFFQGSYRSLWWGFLGGGAATTVVWVFERVLSPDWRGLVNIPLICLGAIAAPEKPSSILAMAAVASFFSQYWLKRYRVEWHSRYNNVLASGLDAGTALTTLAVFALGIGQTPEIHCPSIPHSGIDIERCNTK